MFMMNYTKVLAEGFLEFISFPFRCLVPNCLDSCKMSRFEEKWSENLLNWKYDGI